jgi:hypothetical protein
MVEKTIEKVEEYVYKNYKSYVGKGLIIRESEKCFFVLKHKDGSPLILGKEILN